jgi:hypothetical protein
MAAADSSIVKTAFIRADKGNKQEEEESKRITK